MHTKDELSQLQALPLEIKIRLTQNRIREWIRQFGTDGVYVSFSGGKDSTVLLHIVREMYPSVEAVFVDTGLEYPEIRQFVKTFDNVTILRPKMRFDEVIKKYGYPMISKNVSDCVYGARLGQKSRINNLNGMDCDGSNRKTKYSKSKYKPLLYADFRISHLCCDTMKKSPMYSFQKKSNKLPFIATMASESIIRESAWIKNGCNSFDGKHQKSAPISFWKEQDVLEYIKRFDITIASVYGDIVETDGNGCEYDGNLLDEKIGKYKTTGCSRTGCIFCGFGCHLEKSPSRFERLKVTHPKQYAYCLNGGEYNEQGLWQPNKDGLGMKHIFDVLNSIYGDGFIKY